MKMRFLTLIMTVIFSLLAGPSLVMGEEKNEFAHWLAVSKEDPLWTAVFQKQALSAVRSLLYEGKQKKVGGFDLAKLEADILTVRWRAVRGVPMAVGPNGSRSAATYSVKEKLVIVSLDEWGKGHQATWMLVALHESLGALGYRDEKYSISTTLNYLASISAARFDSQLADSKLVLSFLEPQEFLVQQDPSVANTEQRKDSPAYLIASAGGSGGGITGIGGGGDGYGATMKFSAAVMITARWNVTEHGSLTFSEVLSAILDADVERTKEEIRSNGQVIVDNTQVTYDENGLHMVVPRNDVILDPTRNEFASLYSAYLGDEAIRVMLEAKAQKKSP